MNIREGRFDGMNKTMEMQPIALKEWASAISALQEGKQILIMRKGGIVEETRDFQLKSRSFYLYPTYEHQRKELLKEENAGLVDETLAGWSPEDTSVKLTAYAEAVEDIEIVDQEQLNLLRGLHIWTDHFAEERLKWKRKNPLHVVILRVYKLQQPLTVSILPEYVGCKSWLRIEEGSGTFEASPVLSDEQFVAARRRIHEALGR